VWNFAAFIYGAMVGVVGGLIGLGGADFRLPLLSGIALAIVGTASRDLIRR
jgi:hypothetical protein